MWLIVGLGNPGDEYALTRHNIGFMALDGFLKSVGGSHWSSEHKAHVAKFKLDGEQVILAKPMTYMNRSGESVQALMNFYKIDKDKVLVLQDDIDQAFGKIRFHKNRGHGGHNGIRDISEKLATADYARLKLGVGRPAHPDFPVADYVLGRFNKEEEPQMSDFLNKSLDAVECFIFEGLQKASTKFNG